MISLQVFGAMAASGVGASLGSDWDVVGAILGAGPVVKGVMLLLLAFSILTWGIIIAKIRQLRRARRENGEFFRLFWAAPDLSGARQLTAHLQNAPAARIFREGLAAAEPLTFPEFASPGEPQITPRLGEDAPGRAVRRALTEQGEGLSRHLSFLATCGNTAPFIGLFGTVWGIMNSFHNIGIKGSASLATVAPGIAEALIATAAGLAAAIPAVMAYNYFLGQVRRLEAELGDFAGELTPLLSPPGSVHSTP